MFFPLDSSDDEQHSFQVDFQFRVNNDFSGSRNSASSNSPQSLGAQHEPSLCSECAPNSTSCNKNENSHCFYPDKALKFRVAKNINQKYRIGYKKRIPGSPSENLESNCLCAAIGATGELAAASPWQCKRCTMVNRAKCLVCEACETSRDFDPKNGRAVCPMCTLVNEPGRRKCELCETDLQVRNSDSSQDSCSD